MIWNITDFASVSNANSQIANLEFNELNSESSQNNISSNNPKITHKRVISDDISDDELAFAIINILWLINRQLKV